MSTHTTTPAVLIGDERTTYRLAADKARTAYRRKHGATTLQNIVERRAWQTAHAAPMAAAADRSGMTAVRKAHQRRVDHLTTATEPDRVGGPAVGEFLAMLTSDAEHAAARLDILAPLKRKPAVRKAATPQLTAVPDVVEESAEILAAGVDSGRVLLVAVGAPETVPAPMPAMTRAARKATRREIAATLRAAGIRPEGSAWRDACAAAGLPVRDEVSA